MPSKTDREDISTIIETETAHAISKAMSKNKTDLKQLAVIMITIVTLATGAVLWATNSHADIKEWTAEQDFVTKSELQEVIKEQYVKREDFAIVKQKLENLNDNHNKLLLTLEKMDRKLDRLESLNHNDHNVSGRRTR